MSEIETPPLQQHPKVWDPATLVLLVILCVFGAIIGVQLLVSLGVTPNTAIIGAMAAMIVAPCAAQVFRPLSLGACAKPCSERHFCRHLRCG